MRASPSTVSASPVGSPHRAEAVSASFSPLYQQIKGLVLQSLLSGEWKPGDAIPSELDLAARYRVSQGTVRKAIDELASENLLTRRQGKGTFVATHSEEKVQYRFLKLVPDAGGMGSLGPARRHFIDCKRQRAPADVARLLGLRSGEPTLQLQRVLAFQDTPTIFEDIWLPGGPFKGLTAERLAAHSGPMYAMFESEFGVRMVRADEKIRAVCPTPLEQQWLQVAAGTPLLSVERVAYTYNNLPMELRRGLYRTDKHHYRHELS